MLAGALGPRLLLPCFDFAMQKAKLSVLASTLSSLFAWRLLRTWAMRSMLIRIDLATLRKTHWHEYALRFVFGGLVTAGAVLVAERWGPGVGGLFLVFPAIWDQTGAEHYGTA